MSEQAMLRANILRLFQLCAKTSVATSLDAANLQSLLRQLNLAMKDALWGGSEQLAKRAVHHAISEATRHNESKSTSGQAAGRVAPATTLSQVIRPLRRLSTRALLAGTTRRGRREEVLAAGILWFGKVARWPFSRLVSSLILCWYIRRHVWQYMWK